MKQRQATGSQNPVPNPRRQQQVVVSLGKPSLRLRLESYYSLIAPDIISNEAEWRNKFEQIYQKFGGSYEGEKKLASKLAKKYGTGVRLLLAESALRQKHAPAAAPQNDSTGDTKHEEEWYNLRPEEIGSGNVDFLSDSFDPLSALCRPESEIVDANPWISSSPILDSVGKFFDRLPECDPLRREPRIAHSRKRPPTASDANLLSKKSKTLSPFALIAQNYETGPLSVLFRLQNQRIRALVRYVNGIRGTVTGTLIAFDKHMNMIIRDCEEVYSPRPTGDDYEQKESNLDTELTRRRNALQECLADSNVQIGPRNAWSIRQRAMKQILVRGDNVVLVYKAATERSTWPRTEKSPAKSRYNRPIVAVPDNQRVGSPGSLVYAFQRKQQKERRKST